MNYLNRQSHSLLLLLSFLLCSILSSCTTQEERKRYAAILEHADSLAETNPDSALATLHQIVPSFKKEGIGVVAKKDKETALVAQLLRIKIDDKLYRPIIGYEKLVADTLLPYFRHHNAKWLPTALFYAGRIYADKGDAPRAIDYYQKVLEELPHEGCERFCGLVHIQIGWLFLYQDLYDLAIDHLKKAYLYETFVQDTVYMTHTLQSIGYTFLRKNSIDSAYVYYQKSLSIASKGNNRQVQTESMGQMAYIHIWKKEYKAAKKYLSRAMANADTSQTRMSALYQIALTYHYEQNNIDSALYYCRKLLEVGDISNRYTAYKALASIHLKKGQPKYALEYQNKWEECDDSIRKMKNTEVLARVNSLYNYQQMEKENHKLQQINEQTRWYSIVLALLVLIATFILIAYYQYTQKRNIANQRRIQLLQQVNEKITRGKQNTINQQNGLNDSLNTQIKQSKDCLQQLEMRKKRELAMSILASEVGKKARKTAKEQDGKFSESDWQEIFKLIDKNFPSFKQSLHILHKLSDDEYKICVLEILEFKNIEMAHLLFKEPSTISTSRKRIFEKLSSSKGSATDLRTFLYSI